MSSTARGSEASFFRRLTSLQGGLLALMTLTVANVVLAIDKNVIGLIIEPVRMEFAINDRQAGLIAGLAYALGFSLTVVPIGMLVDRVNRVRLTALLIAIWSGVTFFSSFSASFWQLFMFRFAVGAAEAGGLIAMISLLADYFDEKDRGFAISTFSAGNTIGVIIIFLFGGIVIENFGWRIGFAVAGLPGLFVAVAILFLRDPIRRGNDTSGKVDTPTGFLTTLRRILASSPLVYSMIGFALGAFALFGTLAWTVALLSRVHGLSISVAGFAMAASIGVLQTIFLPMFGMIGDRFTDRDRGAIYVTPVWGLLASFPVVALMVLVPSPALAIGALLALGVTSAAWVGPCYAAVATLAPSESRGTVLSVLQLVVTLIGLGLGPLAVGTLSEALGGSLSLVWGVLSVSAFFVPAALSFWVAMNSHRNNLLQTTAAQANA